MHLVLIRQSYRADGGAEQFVARAARALGDQGVDITLIARTWPPAATSPVHLEQCNPFSLGAIWRDLGFALCACRRLRVIKADLVQTHERIACADIFRAGDGLHRVWLTQRRRTLGPFGRLRLWFNPYHAYAQYAEARTLLSPRLRAVICGSQMVREEIQKAFPIAPEKLVVLYNGVDCTEFRPALKDHRKSIRQQFNIPLDTVLFLFVGSGFYRKGLKTMLAVLADLPPTAGLLVVGQDKHQKAYAQQAAAYGITHRVWFVGRQTDPKPFYGAADAFALPALYDPSPNVILEAMASGLPVLASTKSGTSELLTPHHNGFVLDALDHQGWVQACTAILDKDTRHAMGRAARVAIEPYDLALMGQRFVQFYQGLLSTKGKYGCD